FSLLLFFFFQAEDGIRGFHVTGVQTCALPIFLWCPNKYPTQKRSSGKSKRPIRNWGSTLKSRLAILGWSHQPVNLISSSDSVSRSEERRVGKGGAPGGRRIVIHRRPCWTTTSR